MKNLVIIGISDTADRIISFVEHYKLFNIIGCAVDKEFLPKNNKIFLGGGERIVWSLDELHKHIDIEKDFVFVALFWNRLNADRRKVYERIKSLGFKCTNIISPKASVRSPLKGKNCWICDNVVIQERVSIYNNIYIMDNALIGHRSVLQDNAFIAARAIVMGASHIGNQSFIGVNSCIFDEVYIGEKCLIGACTIIKRHVPNYSVVKTDNNTNIIKQYTEDEVQQKLLAHHNKR